MYRRILGPVYDSENENWRLLTNKEIYASVKKTYYNRVPRRILYMNLGTTRLRGRPRNRWQDEVREDGRSSSEWQGIVTFCTCQWNERMNHY